MGTFLDLELGNILTKKLIFERKPEGWVNIGKGWEQKRIPGIPQSRLWDRTNYRMPDKMKVSLEYQVHRRECH